MNSNKNRGILILRYGLAIVFLWFGYSQVLNPSDWIGWVPLWTESVLGLTPATVVLMNGLLEIAGGTLLAANLYTRWVAIILTAHLALITFEVGLGEIGVRDFGLTAATLALIFLAEE